MNKKLGIILFGLSLLTWGCSREEQLVLGFVPSAEAEKIATTVKPLTEILSRKLGIKVKSYLATDYTAIIEAIGSGKVDMAFLPPFAYVVAHDKYGAEVLVKAKRYGKEYYRGQFTVRKDSGIDSLKQLKGKIWAYPDASSSSGYLFPKYKMIKLGIDPDKFFAEKIQTGSHDNAILAVYNGEADLATTFEGAENRLVKDYPDVKEKIKIIGYTDNIPNDGLVVRRDLDPQMKEKIKQVFLSLNQDSTAMEILKKVYAWDGIVPASDSDYQIVREVAKTLKITIPK